MMLPAIARIGQLRRLLHLVRHLTRITWSHQLIVVTPLIRWMDLLSGFYCCAYIAYRRAYFSRVSFARGPKVDLSPSRDRLSYALRETLVTVNTFGNFRLSAVFVFFVQSIASSPRQDDYILLTRLNWARCARRQSFIPSQMNARTRACPAVHVRVRVLPRMSRGL